MEDAQVVIAYSNHSGLVDFWGERQKCMVCRHTNTHTLIYICVCVCITPSLQEVIVLVSKEWWCFQLFGHFSHPRSRHLYNSICLTDYIGAIPQPKHWHDVSKEREREAEAARCDGAKTNMEGIQHIRPSRKPNSSPMLYHSPSVSKSQFLQPQKVSKYNFLTVGDSVQIPRSIVIDSVLKPLFTAPGSSETVLLKLSCEPHYV